MAIAQAGRAPVNKDFGRRWAENWVKSAPTRPKTVSAAIVLRVDIAGMIGAALPETDWAVERLVGAVLMGLDEVLAGGALYWSPAPGIVDIHYGKLPKKSAELKHAVVVATMQRCLRELPPGTSDQPAADQKKAAAPRPDKLPSRVDWETFRAICAKARARPEHIHVVDIGEVLFGAPTPNQRLPRRVWNAVDAAIDEFLSDGGYCTRYPGNRLCLFFPGMSRPLGEMKSKAIANAIEHAISQLVRDGDEAEDEQDADQADAEIEKPEPEGKTQPAAKAAPKRKLTKEELEEEELRQRATQAVAAMAAKVTFIRVETADLEMPEGFALRFSPLWRAINRNLVGQVAEPTVETQAGPSRYLPELEESEQRAELDLPVLAASVERIKELIATQSPYLVNVPVGWQMLERKTPRTKYQQFLAGLPKDVRRFLVLALVGAPDEILPARIDDRVRELRPYCRAVTCGVGLGCRSFEHFRTPSVHAVGIDLGREPEDERYIIRAMDKFMDAAQPLQLRTYVYGVPTTSLLIAALASGFDYLSGSAIVDSEDRPRGIREFTIPDIFGDDAPA